MDQGVWDLFADPAVIWGMVAAFGLCIEAFVTTPLLFLWLAAAALCLIELAFAMPVTAAGQALALGGLGLATYPLTRRWMRRSAGQFTTGDIREQIEAASPGTLDEGGFVRMDEPFMGSRQWPAMPNDAVHPGDRVRVVGLSGNQVKIEKLNVNGG